MDVCNGFTRADLVVNVAGQCSFQSNRVWIEALQRTEQETQNE
jgi:hypothetical protein